MPSPVYPIGIPLGVSIAWPTLQTYVLVLDATCHLCSGFAGPHHHPPTHTRQCILPRSSVLHVEFGGRRMYPWTGGGGGVWVGRTGKSWIVRAVRVKIYSFRNRIHTAPYSTRHPFRPSHVYRHNNRMPPATDCMHLRRSWWQHVIWVSTALVPFEA